MPLPKIEQDIGTLVVQEFFKNVNKYIFEKEKEFAEENPDLARYVLSTSAISATRFGEHALVAGHGGALLVYNTISKALKNQKLKMPVVSRENIESLALSLNKDEKTRLTQPDVAVKYVEMIAEKNMTVAQVLKTADPKSMPRAREPYYMIGAFTYFLLERQYEIDELKELMDAKK